MIASTGAQLRTVRARVDDSTLKGVLLADDGIVVIMALAAKGRGREFAVGGLWLYHEYINRKDNRKVAANLIRMLLQIRLPREPGFIVDFFSRMGR